MTLSFHHHTLDNGLNIIAEVDQDAHSAAIGFFVKTGARDEASELMGVSHFLEHMMFKGTETRPAEAVDRDFDRIGANHNAFTTSELTAFWAHCLPEHLASAEDVLSDIMRPAIRQQDFDDEKQVILEEIAMYRDQPFWELYERALEVYYRDHPLAHRVLGTEQTVSDMTRDGMKAYFDDRYSADNTVVALSGNLDFDAMVAHLQDHCGDWKRTDTARVSPTFTPTPERFTIESESATQGYLLIVAPSPARTDDRRYAASILSNILGDSDGSRLYWALIETGIAEEAIAQVDGRDGIGEYLVYASGAPERLDEIESIVQREMNGVIDSISEDDLERVRNKIATAITLAGERPAGRMRRLGQLWTYEGTYRPLDEELARINAVTLDEIRAVHEAFPLTPLVTGTLRPA